jgi:hypothetical protein
MELPAILTIIQKARLRAYAYFPQSELDQLQIADWRHPPTLRRKTLPIPLSLHDWRKNIEARNGNARR